MIGARVARVRAWHLVLLATLVLPGVAGAQGGILKRMKAKAAEAAAKKAGEAIDKATAPAADTAPAAPAARDTATATASSPPPAAPAGRAQRRVKALDPTLLESPGRPASAAAAGPPPAMSDPLNEKEWHGTPQSTDVFAATIPPITDASIEAYIRARRAQGEEAHRLLAMWKPPHQLTRAWRDSVRAMQSTPLAPDEQIPAVPGWAKLSSQFNSKGEFERRLDAVADRALGGTLTRLQFYQVQEIVMMFMWDKKTPPGTKGPGRDLTKAEWAALERHRADLVKLDEFMKSI